jgi:hypothetical protein
MPDTSHDDIRDVLEGIHACQDQLQGCFKTLLQLMESHQQLMRRCQDFAINQPRPAPLPVLRGQEMYEDLILQILGQEPPGKTFTEIWEALGPNRPSDTTIRRYLERMQKKGMVVIDDSTKPTVYSLAVSLDSGSVESAPTVKSDG